jgi:hypothetical protein
LNTGSGPAEPYPSSRNVSFGRGAKVRDVNLTIRNFSHPFMDDVDAMLAAPGGRAVVVMSDVGGTNGVSNAPITLDDEAPAFLPDEEPGLSDGRFVPANAATTRHGDQGEQGVRGKRLPYASLGTISPSVLHLRVGGRGRWTG